MLFADICVCCTTDINLIATRVITWSCSSRDPDPIVSGSDSWHVTFDIITSAPQAKILWTCSMPVVQRLDWFWFLDCDNVYVCILYMFSLHTRGYERTDIWLMFFRQTDVRCKICKLLHPNDHPSANSAFPPSVSSARSRWHLRRTLTQVSSTQTVKWCDVIGASSRSAIYCTVYLKSQPAHTSGNIIGRCIHTIVKLHNGNMPCQIIVR
jgi:hypothetical protein